jgi:hypothetical protein
VTQGAAAGTVPIVNSDEIATRIGRSLTLDFEHTIGQPYLKDLRVRIAHVKLPSNVQRAIDTVQAKYAAVNGAVAEYRQAQYQAKRNRLLGATYNKSPALAEIDALKAIPSGSTVIVNTGGKSPNVFAGAGAGVGAASTAPTTTGAADGG